MDRSIGHGSDGRHGLRARAADASRGFAGSAGHHARPVLRGAVSFTALVVALACTDAPLADSARSPEALVEHVLAAVEAKDDAALARALVTRQEYEGLLWSEMPDKEYAPFEFVWSLAEVNNRKGIRQVLSEFGGLPLELVSIEFEEDPEVYESFVMRPGARVVVRRTDTGDEGVLPSFDVFVEYEGAWKLLNYDEL